MNKTASCFKMLRLLYDRKGVVSRKELADYLETNIRNISEYKLELEQAGYNIETVSGVYGGYKLNTKMILPVPLLDDTQYRALDDARKYLSIHDDFPMWKDFDSALQALNCVLYQNDPSNTAYLRSVAENETKNVRDFIQKIDEAIKNSFEISFMYKKNKGKDFFRVTLHPYAYFYKEGRFYVNGYATSIKEKAYHSYAISDARMQDLVVSNKVFSRDMDYKLDDYVGKSSVFKGDEINLVLRVHRDLEYYVREKINGYNYHVEECDDDNYLIVKTTFDNQLVCMSYVLSFGGKAEVLEPSYIREEVINKIDEMRCLYHQ